MDDLWAIEFRVYTNIADSHNWHIDKLKTILISNNYAISNDKNIKDTWLLMAVANSYDEAVVLRDKMRRNYSNEKGV